MKKFFGDIPPPQLPPRPEFSFQPVKPETQKLDTDLPYGLVALTFRFPGSDSPDYAAAQILGDVLSSQRGKLYGLVPEGKALFAAFSYDGMQKAGLGYAVAGFPAGRRCRAAGGTGARHSRGGNHQRRGGGFGRGGQTAGDRRRGIPEKLRFRPGYGAGRRRSRAKDGNRRTTTSKPSGG